MNTLLSHQDHIATGRDLIVIHSRMCFIAGEILQRYRRFCRFGGKWVKAMNAINDIVIDLNQQWSVDCPLGGDPEPYDWTKPPLGAEPLTYVEPIYKRYCDVLPPEDHLKIAIELDAINDQLLRRFLWLRAKGYRNRLHVPMNELITAMQREANTTSASVCYDLVEPSR